jgi:hypothetical protein
MRRPSFARGGPVTEITHCTIRDVLFLLIFSIFSHSVYIKCSISLMFTMLQWDGRDSVYVVALMGLDAESM